MKLKWSMSEKASYWVLVGTIFTAIATWGVEHMMHGHGGEDIMTLGHLFSFLFVIGPVLVAWGTNESGS